MKEAIKLKPNTKQRIESIRVIKLLIKSKAMIINQGHPRRGHR